MCRFWRALLITGLTAAWVSHTQEPSLGAKRSLNSISDSPQSRESNIQSLAKRRRTSDGSSIRSDTPGDESRPDCSVEFSAASDTHDNTTLPADLSSGNTSSSNGPDGPLPEHEPDTSITHPFRCTVPGCYKAYTKLNGLVYHRQSNHCAPPAPNDPKPFKCYFESCLKMYRNSNGLGEQSSNIIAIARKIKLMPKLWISISFGTCSRHWRASGGTAEGASCCSSGSL